MMGRRAAKIANVKGREDAKRGKTFARIGKKIIMACTCPRCFLDRERGGETQKCYTSSPFLVVSWTEFAAIASVAMTVGAAL